VRFTRWLAQDSCAIITAMKIALDQRDRQLLTLLRSNAWLSYTALSHKVHLSASAVQRRVERLIAAGVILGARAEVCVEAGPPPLTVFLLAELADESRAALRRFSNRIAAHPAVIEAHYVAGETDVLLKLHLPDMAAYDRFVASHLNSSRLVRKFKTLTVLRSLVPTAL
jgi:Lrp/AsnC family transcriptional regulator, leucine-responsive regulatory protein